MRSNLSSHPRGNEEITLLQQQWHGLHITINIFTKRSAKILQRRSSLLTLRVWEPSMVFHVRKLSTEDEKSLPYPKLTF